MSKYFNASEFRKCSPACDISQMSPAFLALLDRVREAAGIPLVLNCAYRSKAYEKTGLYSGKTSVVGIIANSTRTEAAVKFLDYIYQN